MRERKKIICEGCKKEFYPISGYLKQKYCNKNCFYTHKKTSPKKGKKYPHLQRARVGNCLVCGKGFRAVNDFTGKDGIKREQKYCSKKCWSTRGVKLFEGKCRNCDKIFYIKDKRGKFCSRKCSQEYMIGDKAPRWKDGLSLERDRARDSKELILWKIKVHKKNNYTCQKCGNKRNLHAHHLKEWAEYTELRFDIDNGITLCEKCHGEIHNKDFSNRRNKKCTECGIFIDNQANTGLCMSCAIKKSWIIRKQRWEEFTGQKAIKLSMGRAVDYDQH